MKIEACAIGGHVSRDPLSRHPASRHSASRRPASRHRASPTRLAAAGLVSSLLLVAGCSGGDPASAASRTGGDAPPIFLIVIDTARADHFSCYGHSRLTTPHLDALAADGVRYAQARAPAQWTLPSHASLFTGLWPSEHGLHWATLEEMGIDQPARGRAPVLRQPERLLAEVLQTRGYSTAGFSNNPWVSRRYGLAAGFEHFYELFGEERERLLSSRSREERHLGPQIPQCRAGETLRFFLAHWQEHRDERPPFVFFNLVEPHFPYAPPKDFAGKLGGDAELAQELQEGGGALEKELIAGKREGDPEAYAVLYDEELLAVDAVLGCFFDWLEEEGLYSPSLVIVTSDHGEHLGEDGRWSHQLSIENELLHVPLIVKYPGQERAGTVVHEAVSSIEAYPLILAAARGSADPGDPSAAGDTSLAARSWFLAESHYSTRHLQLFHKIHPDFDVAAHSHLQRLVFAEGWTYWWEDGRPVKAIDPDGRVRDEPPPEEVVNHVHAYQKLVDALPAQFVEYDGDDSDLEAIRQLGYIK